MALTLRFQSTGAMPGGIETVAMRGDALTIGRDAANDLVLPDPDRVISKRHCVLERHGAEVLVIDLSTNGTFLNYARTRLGRAPATLNPGDVLSLGPYELVVEFTEDRAVPAPPLPGPAAASAPPDPGPLPSLEDDGADILEEILGPDAGPAGPRRFVPEDLDVFPPPLAETGFDAPPQPRDAPEIARGTGHRSPVRDHFAPPPTRAYIPEGWDAEEDRFGALTPPPTASGPPAPETTAPETAASEAAPPPPVRIPPEAAPRPEAPRRPEPAGRPPPDAARAFLEAAGLADLDIPEAELPETLARLGAVLRILVAGAREVLMARTAIKNEFRMDRTLVRASDNNPLKFSVSPDQAMAALARPTVRGYLPAAEAAAEAMRDIRAHEVAMVAGMEAALRAVLKRLDPQALAGRIEDGGALSGLFKGRKERYWEVYEKMYAEISETAENDFQDFFGKEFAKAYQDQTRKI